MAGGQVLGTLAHLLLGPHFEGMDTALAWWHIALPPETPRAPRHCHGTAGHHAARSSKRQANET